MGWTFFIAGGVIMFFMSDYTDVKSHAVGMKVVGLILIGIGAWYLRQIMRRTDMLSDE